MIVDEDLGQPLVKSLVEGEFYYPKVEMMSRSRKVVSFNLQKMCARTYVLPPHGVHVLFYGALVAHALTWLPTCRTISRTIAR